MKFLFYLYIFGAVLMLNDSMASSSDLPSIPYMELSPSNNGSVGSYEDSPTGISFSLPLIHQSSPLHPFYNASMSNLDIFLENLQLSRKRAHYMYRGRAWGTSLQQIPVSHDFLLLYSIGEPPVETSGVADTGSELMWLQCEPCQSCYKQDAKIFDPRQSSTYEVLECDSERCTRFEERLACDKDNNCKYMVRYEDGSFSRGNIAEDTITVVGPYQSYRYEKILFGCGYYNEETTDGTFSGVVGLTNTDMSFIGQLGARIEGRKAFSYCYNSKNNGIFQVGNDARLLGSSTVLIQNPGGYYFVDFVDIKVDGVALDMRDVFHHDMSVLGDQSGVLIDSGSSSTHLHPKAFDTLLKMIDVHMAAKGKEKDKYLYDIKREHCWKNFPGGATDPSLPEITFLFLDLPIVLGENAWFEIPSGSHISVCLAMSRFRGNLTIIGHDQLMNYNLGFDLENMELWMEKQESGCPLPKGFN